MVCFGIWMAVYCVVMLIDGDSLPRPVKTDFVHVVGALVPMIPLPFAMQTVRFLQWMAAVPTISLGWVWPIIAVFYGIGAAFARRKYS
jgi:VIT1/CCC1 family predicted Fe2+/Mn2+ transporter